MTKPNLKKMMSMQPKMRVENMSGKEYKLMIYGAIGDWWGETSADDVRRELKWIDPEVIHVHIHSPGGDAFDGVAIYNLLKNHKAEIIVHIDGYACSAASVIAMAGDKIIMPSNTMMMVHQASTVIWGNADDFEKAAVDLRKIDTALRASYKSRYIGTEDELIKLLADETWLTADEAVALGFADDVTDEIEIIDTQEDEKEIGNIKDDLVAKYAAKLNTETPKEPEQEPAKQANLSRLFLKL